LEKKEEKSRSRHQGDSEGKKGWKKKNYFTMRKKKGQEKRGKKG